VEAAQSLGAGPLWIPARYLLRNVITSVPGAAHLTLPTPYSAGAWASWAWAPPNRFRMGADLQQALTRCPRHLRATALYPGLAMVCVGTGAFVTGRGPGGLGERRRWGQGRLMFSHCGGRVCSLSLRFTLLSLSCRLLPSSIFGKEHWLIMDSKPLQFIDQKLCSCLIETPCPRLQLGASHAHPCKPQQESSFHAR